MIRAQYAYRDALDGLRRSIGADLNPATRNIEIVLEDDPSSLPLGAVSTAEGAIQSALAHRPELSAIDRQAGIEDLNARVARAQVGRQLDERSLVAPAIKEHALARAGPALAGSQSWAKPAQLAANYPRCVCPHPVPQNLCRWSNLRRRSAKLPDCSRPAAR